MSDELKLQLMQEIAKSNLKIDQLILEVRGDNYYNKHREEVTKVDDEQVSKAIISINGDEKPLNEKQLFLGVICVLLSKYGWAGNWSDCCNRRLVTSLPAWIIKTGTSMSQAAARQEFSKNASMWLMPSKRRFLP